MIPIEKIKKLRQETSLSISECKKALEKSGGDLEKAKKILEEWGAKFAEKKEKRKTGEGIIASYIHSNKKIGVLLELGCESDFVARSEEFQNLAHEICLQIAAMGEKDILSQPWIKDETKKIGDLINEYIAKFGENIVIKRCCRYEL
jgi:elongation factor Ts